MEEQRNLYEVLGVEKTATQADIKKAYYKLAMQLHPDRNPDKKDATQQFQALQRIYTVLGDPEKRKVYDNTGSLQDCEEIGQDFAELYQKYRSMYVVTEDDINSFAVTYRGSEEERADLLSHYQQCQGCMSDVFAWVMLSDPERDSHRYMDWLDAAIEAGEVARTPAYTKWAKRTAKQPRPPGDPLAPARQQQGGSGNSSQQALVAAIKGKNHFGSLMASLEAKYADNGSKKRKKATATAAAQEPSEEAFAAARARLEARQQGGSNRNKKGSSRDEPAATAGRKQGAAAKQQCSPASHDCEGEADTSKAASRKRKSSKA